MIVPKFVRKIYFHLIWWLDDKKNREETVANIFAQIYHKRKWAANTQEFSSGSGSWEPTVVQPYVNKIIEFLKIYPDRKPRLVDLGCGDFKVGENFINYCAEYHCVDIVSDLIQKISTMGYPAHVKFHCLNIIEDQLPEGDICFLRQVLQHLSNEEISKILPELKKYKTIFITEHYPKDNPRITPNKNMTHGSGVRVYKNSGVYLDKPPFNIPESKLQLILEVPGVGLGKICDQGVIRTYKLELQQV